jgi:hypothetical protein
VRYPYGKQAAARKTLVAVINAEMLFSPNGVGDISGTISDTIPTHNLRCSAFVSSLHRRA